MTPLGNPSRWLSPGAALWREIEALGGAPTTDHERGYVEAIGDVLAILERRGFSEAVEAVPAAWKDLALRAIDCVHDAERETDWGSPTLGPSVWENLRDEQNELLHSAALKAVQS